MQAYDATTLVDNVRFIYALSHITAVVAFVLSGLYQRFQVCFLLLLVSSILAITYHPESDAWVQGIYMNYEPLAFALRFVAAYEVLWYLTPNFEDWSRLLLALLLLAISAGTAVWSLEPNATIYTFVKIRRYGQISTSVFLLAGMVFLWSQGLLRNNLEAVHGCILMVWLLKQAVYSVISLKIPWITMRQWQAADWPGLMVTSLCCLAWAGLGLASGRPRARLSAAGHPDR